jgi:hypothetical protein
METLCEGKGKGVKSFYLALSVKNRSWDPFPTKISHQVGGEPTSSLFWERRQLCL